MAFNSANLVLHYALDSVSILRYDTTDTIADVIASGPYFPNVSVREGDLVELHASDGNLFLYVDGSSFLQLSIAIA
jgi:hypothetical protein